MTVRDAWRTICMMEYRISGDMQRATALADEITREIAHELAEKIRNSEELRDFTDDHMGDCNAAADLIDPYKD